MSEFVTRTNVRKPATATAVIDIGGEITNSAEEDLSAAFAAAAGGSTSTVVLNFADLEYMNSGGIGLLVMLLIRANREGKRLLACGLSDHYRQIFTLTRLDEAIACFDDEATALAAAN